MAISRELLQKKSLQEIDAMIFDHDQKLKAERDLATLGRLNSELSVMREIRDQKMEKSGSFARKNTQASEKPDLKSYDDYIKSKK